MQLEWKIKSTIKLLAREPSVSLKCWTSHGWLANKETIVVMDITLLVLPYTCRFISKLDTRSVVQKLLVEQQILTGNGVRQITSYLGNNGDKQRTTGLGLTQKSYHQYRNNRAQTSMNKMEKVRNYMVLQLQFIR